MKLPLGRLGVLLIFLMLVATAGTVLALASPATLGVAYASPQSLLVSSVLPAAPSQDRFFVTEWSTGQPVEITAVLVRTAEHCLVYVQQGRTVHDAVLDSLVESFDQVIYPTLTQLYGPIPNPGIDGDPRVVLLIYPFNKDGLYGYFYPGDIDPTAWPGPSNRKELISLNLSTVIYDQERAKATAAHELVHMICYYNDFMLDPAPFKTREATWLEEGLAMFSEIAIGQAAGLTPEVRSFASYPVKNLTRWEGGFLSDYGASLVFVVALAENLGLDVLSGLVSEPKDGIAGIEAVLAARPQPLDFASLFETFVVSNFLDGRVGSAPPQGYDAIDIAAASTPLLGPQPVVGAADAPSFGALYLELSETSEDAFVSVVIDGQDGAPLRAALLSWDASTNPRAFEVTPISFSAQTVGGSAAAPTGFRRHALAIWALGREGVQESFRFQYCFGAQDPQVPLFLDVGASHIFYPYIKDLGKRGVISGLEVPPSSGLFYFLPDAPVLRAQFAKIVMEACGLHSPEMDLSRPPTFRDVKPTYDSYGNPLAYPYDYVEEAAQYGIVRGFDNGLFGPWEPITRIQLVRMLLRAAEAAGKPIPSYRGSEAIFADVTYQSPMYKEVMTAYAAGITSGSRGPDGRLYFRPWAEATRGQVSKMASVLLALLEEE